MLLHAPRLDSGRACLLAEQLFGIKASAHELPSERDQNFLLTAESGDRFVLKIANALEQRAFIEAEVAVLNHLEGFISFCPRLINDVSGAPLAEAESAPGHTHLIRLLRFIPGLPLAEVSPHSGELLKDLGRKLGQLDSALESFDHPAVHREFHWDLAHGIQTVREHRTLIADSGQRDLVSACADRFERNVGALESRLRRSVIHGDANDYNILVTDKRVSGLIDFGDMVYSYTVAEIAIALAYVVLDKVDPLQAAVAVVSGYVEEYPLRSAELEVIYDMMLLRLCMSLCLAAYQQRQQPLNEYLSISQNAIRKALPLLTAIESRDAAKAFRGTVDTN